jgi:sulfatase modifying factor 1
LAIALLLAVGSSCDSNPDRGAGGSGTGPGTTGPGPDEVAIQSPNGTAYYVDRTEVTRDAYAAWLATAPSTVPQIAACSENDDFTPTCQWPPGERGGHPVVCVDWCDAFVYCQAQGKRLCGLIGGGPNDYHDYADPALDQWYNACSTAGRDEYPYGAPVGSLPACRTDTGLLDMSGNVREWKDACELDTSSVAFNYCRLGGGSFRDGELRHLSCTSPGQDAFRTGHWDSIGFRCCRDAPDGAAGSGGGGGGGGAGGAEPCNQCLATACTTEDAACLGNEQCITMADCEASCFDQDCVDACASASPAGVADFQVLQSCFANGCATACGWD